MHASEAHMEHHYYGLYLVHSLWSLFRLFSPWSSSYPHFLSMATPPDSAYLPFLRRFVLRHVEKGTMRLLHDRWLEERGGGEGCPAVQAIRALGAEKTVSLFAAWAVGAGAALALLVGEICTKGRRRQQNDSGTSK